MVGDKIKLPTGCVCIASHIVDWSWLSTSSKTIDRWPKAMGFLNTQQSVGGKRIT